MLAAAGSALAPSVAAKTRPPKPHVFPAAGDATVVAVIDGGLMPYHWDFLASKMPQHKDKDLSNDLPLDKAPHTWLPGFPDPKKEFETYSSLELTLDDKNPNASVTTMRTADLTKWETVETSTAEERHLYWMPDTKVIGAMTFGTSNIVGVPGSHGVGTTSSAVGNIHGTCPECLLFFIDYGSASVGEDAIEWAMDQPWIDVISNSYGFSQVLRDRLYSGSDVEAQRAATERGQSVFFSAGNGQDGSFAVPNTTGFSSQEGPDWIVTVGAISPGEDNYYYREHPNVQAEPYRTAYHSSYSGQGKPADIAGIGSRYPTAYTSTTAGGTGSTGFGGTSNATPQIVGTYARALYMVRRALPGNSRIQKADVIAKGPRLRCGSARKGCELGDGKLTSSELRERLFHGAVHTDEGMTAAGVGQAPAVGEEEFLNEGHGSYFGLETGKRAEYLAEFDRIWGPLTGKKKALERPDGELEWMIVDSFCRQHLWGDWKGGYFVEGKTDLPASTPESPIRTAIKESCPHVQPPL